MIRESQLVYNKKSESITAIMVPILLVLLTAFTGHAMAGFKYEDCASECRKSNDACMITRISDSKFSNICYISFSQCSKLMGPQDVCIDFFGDVRGEEAMWPDFKKFRDYLSPASEGVDLTMSSTPTPIASLKPTSPATIMITSVGSDAQTTEAQDANSTPSTPEVSSSAPTPDSNLSAPTPESNSSAPTPDSNSGAPVQDGRMSPIMKIMIVCIVVPALILLAVVCHLRRRKSGTRSTINDSPLKLDSQDFVEVECEELPHPNSGRKEVRMSSIRL